jgi:hypothetical protein
VRLDVVLVVELLGLGGLDSSMDLSLLQVIDFLLFPESDGEAESVSKLSRIPEAETDRERDPDPDCDWDRDRE